MDIPNQAIPSFEPQDIKAPETELDKSDKVSSQVVEDTPVDETAESPKGSKTSESHLYAALEEERQLRKEESVKRRELEQKLKEIELSSALSELDEDSLSEEGRLLKQQIIALNEKLSLINKEREEERVSEKYPGIFDKREDFESFRESYPGVPLDKVARLFLLDAGLLDIDSPRKGLEKSVSSPKEAVPPGITTEDIDRLMRLEPRKFNKMIRDGLIDPDAISW